MTKKNPPHRQSAQGGTAEGEKAEHETRAGAAYGRSRFGGGVGK